MADEDGDDGQPYEEEGGSSSHDGLEEEQAQHPQHHHHHQQQPQEELEEAQDYAYDNEGDKQPPDLEGTHGGAGGTSADEAGSYANDEDQATDNDVEVDETSVGAVASSRLENMPRASSIIDEGLSLEELQRENTELQAELDLVRRWLAEEDVSDTRLTAMDNEVKSAFAQVGALQVENAKMEEQLRSQKNLGEIAEAERQLKEVAAVCKRLIKENLTLKQEQATHEMSKFAQAEQEYHSMIRRVQAEVNAVQENARKAALIMRAREATSALKQRKIGQLQEDNLRLAAQIRDLRAKESAIVSAPVEWTDEDKKMMAEVQAWKAQRVVAERQIEKVNRVLAIREQQLERQKPTADNKLRDTRQAAAALQQAVWKADAQLQAIEREKSTLRAQIDSLSATQGGTSPARRHLPKLLDATADIQESSPTEGRRHRHREDRHRSEKRHQATGDESGAPDTGDEGSPSKSERHRRRHRHHRHHRDEDQQVQEGDAGEAQADNGGTSEADEEAKRRHRRHRHRRHHHRRRKEDGEQADDGSGFED